MRISKDYEQISIHELKAIFEKRTNMSFSVLCANVDGITSMVPIAKADILFLERTCKCKCSEIFDPKTTKYYIQKTLKKHFQGQNEFYKRTFEHTGHGETLAEIKDWLVKKEVLFRGMNASMKESYFIDLHNALTYNEKNYTSTAKHNALIVDVLFDLGVLMRVITEDESKQHNFTMPEKVEHDRVYQVYEKMIYKINTSIIKYIKLNRKNKEFMSDILNNRLLKISFPLSHSIRTFIMYTDFLCYYNEKFNQGLPQKVRKGFEFYQPFYNKVFDTFQNKKTVERLEDVFKDSMQSIPYASLEGYAFAGSIHDIGMFNNIEYYMNRKGYNEKDVQKHLYHSYKMLNRENQQLSTLYTAAFHHEYYGKGYGLFNMMYRSKRDSVSHFYSRHIMSYDIHDVLDFDVVAYFPAKVLEIVDVYDTLLYPWFTDQELQASTVEGVIDLMKKHYIDDVKLDPILFDVFLGYIEDMQDTNLYLYKIWNTNY